MAYNPSSVFEAIRLYVAEVRKHHTINTYIHFIHHTIHLINIYTHTQAPTYHVVIEVVLGLWILYLLFFSKQYRPKSKHDKLTKEVKRERITHHCSNV